MATRKGITPDQLKQASASLGLTVAAIAEGSGLSKAYISEFRSGSRTLKAPQQAQLRAFLEEQCDEQGIDFPEDEEESEGSTSAQMLQQLGGLATQVSRPALLLSEEVPKAQREKLLNLIEANRLKVGEILAGEFKAGGLLGGEFSEATEEAIRQVFAMLALNYVAVLVLQGRSVAKRALDEAATPKTMGDWFSRHLADSPLAEFLPLEESEEEFVRDGSEQ